MGRWGGGGRSTRAGALLLLCSREVVIVHSSWCTVIASSVLSKQAFLFLSCRPHSTDYATHKKMTLPLADRCSRTQKIRIIPISGHDPECQRTEEIKVCWLHFAWDLGVLRVVLSRILIRRFLLPQAVYLL